MRPIDLIFPQAVKDKANFVCPICHAKINPEEFKDALSVKEYQISGLCQKCQDATFGNERSEYE